MTEQVAKLETDIATLMTEFEKSTGFRVNGIEVQHYPITRVIVRIERGKEEREKPADTPF